MFVGSLNVINTQSLHYKNDWTSKNLDYTLHFSCFYTVIQGVLCDWILENRLNCHTRPIPFYWPS